MISALSNSLIASVKLGMLWPYLEKKIDTPSNLHIVASDNSRS